MPVFNVGDRVKCVDDGGDYGVLTVGTIYTIRRVYQNHNDETFVNVVGGAGGFYPNRFQLVGAPVRPEPNTEVYLVFYKNVSTGMKYQSSYTTEASALGAIDFIKNTPNLTYIGRKKIKIYVDWDGEPEDAAG